MLFIDFLGFKTAVEETIAAPASLGSIVDALDAVGAIGADIDHLASQRVTQFSDSVVVSYRIEERSAVFHLLNAIGFCIVDLVERGFLLRGAVTMGSLLHTGRHVVGPALNKAYEMESRLAVHPRIIVDPAVVAIAREAKSEDHDADEEEGYVRGQLRTDADGRLFLDYISWSSVVGALGGENDLYPGYLAKIGRIVVEGLRHVEPGILAKYLWLHAAYVAAIDSFGPSTVRPEYERDNREIVADIRGLPRFEAEAAKASRIVTKARSTKT